MGGKKKSVEEAHMWFLFYCEEDESYSVVDNNAVPNWEVVKEHDTSVFFYCNKSYVGEVQKRNADRDALDNELKVMGKKAKRVMKMKSGPSTSKRHVNPPKRFVPYQASSPKENKRKKSDKTVMNETKQAGASHMNKDVLTLGGSLFDESELETNADNSAKADSDEDMMVATMQNKTEKKKDRQALISSLRQIQDAPSTSCRSVKGNEAPVNNDPLSAKSPSKEELKRMLLEAESKLSMMSEDDATKNEKTDNHQPHEANSSKESSEIDDTLDEGTGGAAAEEQNSIDDDTSNQLYGKDSGEPMVHLVDNVYCKKQCIVKALKQCTRLSHLVRRLLPGVFKMDAIVSCTLTGQKPRAAGNSNYGEDVSGLDPTAVSAILQFAKTIGKARNWEKFDIDKLRQALSQRVGEITREFKAKEAAKLNKKDQQK